MQRLVRNIALVLGSLMLVFAAAGSASAQVPAEHAAPTSVVKVGEPAPDFSLPASDGKTYHLAELKARKPLVLVIFRGVW